MGVDTGDGIVLIYAWNKSINKFINYDSENKNLIRKYL